jgi:branched-chain amino acid transport system ATP-binding protein
MFDEPTAGMSVDEVPVVLDLIRTSRKGDKTILLVEHKMDVVRSSWPTASSCCTNG